MSPPVAVVTGANRGIGRAIAVAFAAAGYAVLASARFGDYALLAKTLRKQDLANGIVYFVRAGMTKVFAFQINAGMKMFAQPFCKV